jgi:hypothetical protein
MLRLRRVRSLITWVGVALALGTPSAFAAADKLQELQVRLKSSPDFRVRTQAALALGVTADERAIVPLCGALDDDNRTVRAAAAAALGKLARGGRSCVEARLLTETDPKLRDFLTKVLPKLPAPSSAWIGPETRYYIAIGPTTNATGSPDNAVEELVRAALENALKSAGKLAVAPAGESTQAAQVLLAKHTQLKPVFVWPKVQAEKAAGGLSLRWSLSLFSYPDKAFKGSVSQKLTLPGAHQADPAALRELLQAGAPKLANRLLTAVDQLH